MNLVPRKIKHGHSCESVHMAAVLVKEVLHGLSARGALYAGFAASEEQTGCEALQVVLKGGANGLVKVVDIEGKRGIGVFGRSPDLTGKGTKVGDVGVTTDLGENSRIRVASKVGRHDWNGAAKETEW
jgi:hypothetical protein